jgi:hypothetical protein
VEEDVAVEAQEEEEVETAKRTRRGETLLTLTVLREGRSLSEAGAFGCQLVSG